MSLAARRSSTLLATLLVALSVACDEPPKTEQVFPLGKGIRQDATLSGLQSGGWTVCYQGAYAEGASVASILAGCTGRYMLLGCRASDTTDALALAAADLREVVTRVDGAGQHHTAGGVGWYFNDGWSWGFFPAAAAVNLDSCDTDSAGVVLTMKDQRLCWETSEGNLTGGFRCGDNNLNPADNPAASAAWHRLIMVHP